MYQAALNSLKHSSEASQFASPGKRRHGRRRRRRAAPAPICRRRRCAEIMKTSVKPLPRSHASSAVSGVILAGMTYEQDRHVLPTHPVAAGPKLKG